MDEELPKPEPKISEVEIILVGLFFGLLDVIDIIPIAGDITDVIAAPMGLYYWSKGINATAFIAAEILDLIPVAQEIPSRTIGWAITVVLDRSPKLQAKFAPIGRIAGALEGNVEENEALATESIETPSSTTGRSTKTINRESQGTTIDMTQAEDGSYGYERGEQAESQNARPSEKSTERGSQAQENEAVETGEAPSEDAAKAAKQAELERQMEPSVEQGPEVEANKRAFGVIQGGKNRSEDDLADAA
jgi:hypothetical protein